ncbi:hypothetical protein C8Q74DRAFT_393820 [Fomes fomentarius]|nr:hypothetical protein C8Q74DRAFT_393820 [Fomes fomentarius]
MLPAGSSFTVQHSVSYMEHVQSSDSVEHRTWHGGSHIQENISLFTFGEEPRSLQGPAVRETTVHSFNAGPEAEPVPELPNDPSNEPPPPQYTRKAAPHTPPPSYADVIKNGRASLPSPRPGSRAAVWPSRHDSSPVPQRSESSSTPNADDPAHKRHAHRRATKPRAPDRPPTAPRLHSYTYLRESETTVRSGEGWTRIRTDSRLPVVDRSVGTRRVVADQQRRTIRVLQEDRCAAAQPTAQRQQGAQQGEPAPRPRTAYNAARRKSGSAAKQAQRGRFDSGPVDRIEAPHAEDVPALVHSSRTRSLPLQK